MRICRDCEQPEGAPHRNWCGEEHLRQVKEQAWWEGYAAGGLDELHLNTGTNRAFGCPYGFKQYTEIWVEASK